jgi:hypothetical protein
MEAIKQTFQRCKAQNRVRPLPRYREAREAIATVAALGKSY